jgi:uncharacterized protein (DUF58 family)
VGLVSFGGIVQWLQPGTGQVALYRLLDTLMETELFASFGWRGIRQLPPRTLPPKALIVALSPLLDERVVTALFDLLARGYDLAVIDVSPMLGPAPARGRPARRARARQHERAAALAERLWALQREGLRQRYVQLGAAVVEWRAPAELERVLYEVEAWRRRAVPAPG